MTQICPLLTICLLDSLAHSYSLSLSLSREMDREIDFKGRLQISHPFTYKY